MGRPSIYSQELADRICERLAGGESLRSICRDDGMPHRDTVNRWLFSNEAFFDQYTRARDSGLDNMADEVMEIADTGEDHQRDRLRFDARRWYLSKLAPKRYGDKLQFANNDGTGDAKLDVTFHAPLPEFFRGN